MSEKNVDSGLNGNLRRAFGLAPPVPEAVNRAQAVKVSRDAEKEAAALLAARTQEPPPAPLRAPWGSE